MTTKTKKPTTSEARAVTPSHFDDVTALAVMIARARGRSAPTPFDMRIARDRLAPRVAA